MTCPHYKSVFDMPLGVSSGRSSAYQDACERHRDALDMERYSILGDDGMDDEVEDEGSDEGELEKQHG